MRKGDPVLFYHSQKELAIVGLMQVGREAYPDPTMVGDHWLTCDFIPVRTLEKPVLLKTIRSDQRLASLALIHQPRLAVMAITPEELEIIVAKSET